MQRVLNCKQPPAFRSLIEKFGQVIRGAAVKGTDRGDIYDFSIKQFNSVLRLQQASFGHSIILSRGKAMCCLNRHSGNITNKPGSAKGGLVWETRHILD